MRVVIADHHAGAKDFAGRLRAEGHHVALCPTLSHLDDLVAEERYHLVVLASELLAWVEILDLCRALRQRGAFVLLLLCATDPARLGNQALETGADAYLTRPIGTDALLAYAHALLRRHPLSQPSYDVEGLRVTNDFSLDLSGQRLVGDGREVALSDREFCLLVYLVRHEGRVLTREAILNAVWGYDYIGATREVDVYIRYLRQKIEPMPPHPRYLLTSWGRGYQYRGPRRLGGIAEPSTTNREPSGNRQNEDGEQSPNTVLKTFHDDRNTT